MSTGKGLAFELTATTDEGLVKIDRLIKKL